jgi:hypothetical protein
MRVFWAGFSKRTARFLLPLFFFRPICSEKLVFQTALVRRGGFQQFGNGESSLYSYQTGICVYLKNCRVIAKKRKAKPKKGERSAPPGDG